MSLKPYDLYKILDVQFIGPPISEGPKNCVLYFSISAKESLSLDPYNQPALAIASNDCRIFSITLPGHYEGQDKFKAISYWANHLDELITFIKNAHNFIDHLIKNNIAIEKKVGTMGLSRGGFIASHLATHPEVIASVSFAPLTNLKKLIEFSSINNLDLLETLSLENQIDLLSEKKIRYYIGNRDMRVSTKSAFELIEKLAERAYQKRIRSPQAELFILPSMGQFGHGTSKKIFEKGAHWLKKQIVK